MTTRQPTPTTTQIAQLMKGRTLASYTYGEWDHILSLVDKSIAESDHRRRETGRATGYAYGPATRAKFRAYRDRAYRKAQREQADDAR